MATLHLHANPSGTARPKRLVRQTPVEGAGAVVVTLRYGPGNYETRIKGGQLDGELYPAVTIDRALGNHAGAVELARQAAGRPADEQRS